MNISKYFINGDFIRNGKNLIFPISSRNCIDLCLYRSEQTIGNANANFIILFECP